MIKETKVNAVAVQNFTDAKTGKETYFAYVETLRDNIIDYVCMLKQSKNISILQPCTTKKGAEELADYWNECYKRNGTLAKF